MSVFKGSVQVSGSFLFIVCVVIIVLFLFLRSFEGGDFGADEVEVGGGGVCLLFFVGLIGQEEEERRGEEDKQGYEGGTDELDDGEEWLAICGVDVVDDLALDGV